jgi:acetyltransferase-like isoleucine patch superfamily enzyme
MIMIRRLFIMLLSKTGKDYTPSEKIPTSAFVHELVTRCVTLARGLLRFRTKAFVDKAVRIRGKSSLTLGRFATIQEYCYIDAVSEHGVNIGARSKIGAYTQIRCTNHFSKLGKGVTMGSDSGIGQFSFIGAAGGVTIGNHVIMGQYVSFHAQQHIFDNPDLPIAKQGTTAEGITIDDDVWVGAKVTFLDGAHVGSHSVVAAGSVVRGTFPPNSIIGGVPARILRPTHDTQANELKEQIKTELAS